MRAVLFMNLADWPTTLCKWGALFILAIRVNLPKTLPALLIFMLLDFITGVLAAFVRKQLHSAESFRGLIKKTLIVIMVLTAGLFGKTAGEQFGFTYDIGSLVAMAFIVNEIISITENCARAGVPVPAVLISALAKAKGLAWDPTMPDRRVRLDSHLYRGRERRNGKGYDENL